MSLICGKYNLVDGDEANFEKYLGVTGIPEAQAKEAVKTKTTVEILLNDEEVTVKTGSEKGVHESKFKVGADFEETTLDGRKSKSHAKLGDNQLIVEQNIDNCPKITWTRVFTEGGMQLTLKAGDVTVNRCDSEFSPKSLSMLKFYSVTGHINSHGFTEMRPNNEYFENLKTQRPALNIQLYNANRSRYYYR